MEYVTTALLILGFVGLCVWFWDRSFGLDAYDNAMKRAAKRDAARADRQRAGY